MTFTPIYGILYHEEEYVYNHNKGGCIMATTSIRKTFVAKNKKTYVELLKAVNTPKRIKKNTPTSKEVKRGEELLTQFSFHSKI